MTPSKVQMAAQLVKLSNTLKLVDIAEGSTLADRIDANVEKLVPTLGVPSGRLQKDKLKEVTAHQVNSIFIPAYMDHATRVYADALNEKELSDALAFYESASGRAIMARTPEMTYDMLNYMHETTRGLVASILLEYCTAIKCPRSEYDHLKTITDSNAK